MSVQVVRVGDAARPVAVTQPGRPGGSATPISVGQDPLALSQLRDVDGVAEAPADVPLVWVKDSTGVLRPQAQAPIPSTWGDQIRYRPGPPTDVDAPVGALQIDTTSGRGFRLHEIGD